MSRTLTVFLALFLLSVSAASVSAHVGDVTVETENFKGIPGCPEAVTISWKGNTHLDSDPNRHDTLYYSAGYNAWGRGVGWASIPAGAAQAHTRKLEFPGGRGFTGQYEGRFGQQLRERLSGYPPPKHPPTWSVHITTGLTLSDIGRRMGRLPHTDREWEMLKRDSGYRSKPHDYWVRGLLSDDCLVRLFGVDRTQIPEWQPTPSPLSSPTPWPTPTPLPLPPKPMVLGLSDSIHQDQYNAWSTHPVVVLTWQNLLPYGISSIETAGIVGSATYAVGETLPTSVMVCWPAEAGKSALVSVRLRVFGDGVSFRAAWSGWGRSRTLLLTCPDPPDNYANTPPTPSLTPVPTPSPIPATAPAPTACQFVLGFATLRDLIGHDIVGDCLENEHYAANGNSEQRTTGGLLVWRKSDNWTAFTDGYRTWINGPHGLQQRLNTERFPWEKS